MTYLIAPYDTKTKSIKLFEKEHDVKNGIIKDLFFLSHKSCPLKAEKNSQIAKISKDKAINLFKITVKSITLPYKLSYLITTIHSLLCFLHFSIEEMYKYSCQFALLSHCKISILQCCIQEKNYQLKSQYLIKLDQNNMYLSIFLSNQRV